VAGIKRRTSDDVLRRRGQREKILITDTLNISGYTGRDFLRFITIYFKSIIFLEVIFDPASSLYI
jgi:hypothetical protein